MSLCRGRLFFNSKSERRGEDECVVQTLNFPESDEEVDENCLDTIHELKTPPCSPNKRHRFSEFGSPTSRTPESSPRFKSRVVRGLNNGISPLPFPYDSDGDAVEFTLGSPTSSLTPPHKKFRSLRLYDTPHTPKSLLQKCRRTLRSAGEQRERTDSESKLKISLDPEGPQANVNPFTPESPVMKGKKRLRQTQNDGSFNDSLFEMDEDMPSKKLALHEINTSRYIEEFHEVQKLGDGEFGSVYKCINRLDGCVYAIKKSKMPVAGSAYERNALNEVYAHAVLGKHQHVVRYYSAWAENNHMYIQNEFCNGGSVADLIVENAKQSTQVDEAELKQILLQVAHGLKYIHSQALVHLDIKPGNIFMQKNPRGGSPESGYEDEMEDEEEEEPVTYKIGDLGHVTSVHEPKVEEGDCRYLPNEILHEEFYHLSKADIFSLALTIFQTGSGKDLPKNGDDWHKIRAGKLPPLEQCSDGFNMLLKSMVSPDPTARPSAGSILQHPELCSAATKTKAQLRRELNEEKFKNELLTRKLEEAEQKSWSPRRSPRKACKTFAAPSLQPQLHKSKRLIGKKCHRSMSTTCF